MPAFVLGEKWDVNYFMPAVILWWDTVMCGQTNVAFAIVDVKQMVDVVYKVLIFILFFARLAIFKTVAFRVLALSSSDYPNEWKLFLFYVLL